MLSTQPEATGRATETSAADLLNSVPVSGPQLEAALEC